MPPWIEIIVGALLLVSAVMALASGAGLIRLSGFFPRMHAPALTATLGLWCVTSAAVLYFSALEGALAAYYWLVALFMAITVPITTVLLTRTALQRLRANHAPGTPPPLSLPVPAPENDR
ncbi:MAG: monovalent cation/H(+) antiporter subunit G [Desulfovibrionaceae bacterium]|jgi:multicomponent K+:H+ antiporter subunit G|nr:monovalent cation/H(+) antiporter subunit G [Desulfovibrionaceae bacterium]